MEAGLRRGEYRRVLRTGLRRVPADEQCDDRGYTGTWCAPYQSLRSKTRWKSLDIAFPRKSVLAAVLGSLLNGDLVAESLEALDGAAEGCSRVTLVEIVAAEVFVGGAVADDAVGDDQNRGCHRDQCSFAASPGR